MEVHFVIRMMRVLVVDDEVAVCSCIAEFLRNEGFDVVEAYGGTCGLEIAKQHGESFCAILSDMNMPDVNGIEMWERMKSYVSPECRIVFMSGWAGKYLTEDSGFPGELLQKPFSFSILLQKLIVPTDKCSKYCSRCSL